MTREQAPSVHHAGSRPVGLRSSGNPHGKVGPLWFYANSHRLQRTCESVRDYSALDFPPWSAFVRIIVKESFITSDKDVALFVCPSVDRIPLKLLDGFDTDGSDSIKCL